MTTRIRFNAEPQHVLKVGDQEIRGGEEGDVPDDVAKKLEAAGWTDVTIIEKPQSGAAADTKEKK